VVPKLGILLAEVLRRDPKSVLVGIFAPSNRGARTDTYPNHLDGLKGWLCFRQQTSAVVAKAISHVELYRKRFKYIGRRSEHLRSFIT
jgi:hypothetical protein